MQFECDPFARNKVVASPIVFWDIAGPDHTKLRDFYSGVFGWTFDNDGRFNVPVSTPLGGAIRSDPAEKRFYVGVSDVAESLSQIERLGGCVFRTMSVQCDAEVGRYS